MIKIGTKIDLKKIKDLPLNVVIAIKEDIETLDSFYGDKRDIDTDMGGFVVVCNKGEPLNISNFEKEIMLPEYIQEICPYVKKLFIAGSERNIIVYEKQ